MPACTSSAAVGTGIAVVVAVGARVLVGSGVIVGSGVTVGGRVLVRRGVMLAVGDGLPPQALQAARLAARQVHNKIRIKIGGLCRKLAF